MNATILLKSRIGRRSLLVALAISLAPLLMIGWIAVARGQAGIHKQTLAVLRAASDGSEAAIREFLGYLKNRAVSISLDPFIQESLERVGTGEPGTKGLANLNKHLAQRMSPFREAEEIFVIDLDGRVVGSSSPEEVGKDASATDFFKRGQQTAHISDIFRDAQTGKITWLVTTPVTGRSSGKLAGVLAIRVDPKVLSEVTTGQRTLALGAETQSFRIGDTGETYIVNRDRRMITESRFVPGPILTIKVDSEPVRRAQAEGQQMRGDYVDYRGKWVSGASAIIQEPSWVVLTEIDFRQAYLPLLHLRNVLFGLTILLAVAVFFVTWRFMLNIITPIHALSRADQALASGDLAAAFIPEAQMPQDEIGDAIRLRNQRLKTLLAQQERLLLEHRQRAELLGRMLQESLYFSRAILWHTSVTNAEQDLAQLRSEAEILGSVEAVFGYPVAALHNNPGFWRDNVPPDDLQELERHIRELREGARTSCIYRVRHAQGNWVWMQEQITLARSEDDQGLILQGLGTDVTKLMQTQQRLQQAQNELETKVADRTAHLRATIQSLEGVTYHLAHDLRAPLRAMQGFATLLLEQCLPNLSAECADYAHRVNEAALQMDRLIYGLLEYGRLGSALLPQTDVNLDDAIKTVLLRFRGEIEKRQAVVICEALPHKVRANPEVLQQVLMELLSNALRFVAPGVIPQIRIWSESRADVARLWIEDNGLGIASEYQDRVFRIFEKLGSPSHLGTGIGLAIVAQGMQRMGGRVGLESTLGSGARFWIELPEVRVEKPHALPDQTLEAR